jgi:hypothetical protein
VTVGGSDLTCDPLLKPFAKALSNFRLSPDGARLTFTAEDIAGDLVLFVPTTLPPTDPVPGAYLDLPSDSTVYLPGNY